MKKLMVTLAIGITTMMMLTGCNVTRTTEIYTYDYEKEEYVLQETRVEEIDGIFDEHQTWTFGPVIIE